VVHALSLLPYRLLGERISRLLPLFGGLEKQLLKANIKVSFPAYVAFTLFFPLVGEASIFALCVSQGLLLGGVPTDVLLVGLTFGLSSGLIIFAALFLYPSLQVDSRKRILEEELPYVASHMAILSRASLPPERIFRSLAQVEATGLRSIAAEESRNIVRDVQYLGYDVISAMERCTRNSPSRRFTEFIDGFVSVTRSGGTLTGYFLASAKSFMDSARLAARQLIETLGRLAETYVSMMVVFPLLVIIMLSVMGIIGGSLGGFSTLFLMQLVTYLVLPILAVEVAIISLAFDKLSFRDSG